MNIKLNILLKEGRPGSKSDTPNAHEIDLKKLNFPLQSVEMFLKFDNDLERSDISDLYREFCSLYFEPCFKTTIANILKYSLNPVIFSDIAVTGISKKARASNGPPDEVKKISFLNTKTYEHLICKYYITH